MYYYHVVPLGGRNKNTDFLTYHSDKILKPGDIGNIPLGRQKLSGVVLESCPKPDFTTKAIELTDELPTNLIKLGQWIASYYSTSLSSVFSMMLPSGIHKARRQKEIVVGNITRHKHTNPKFTKDQTNALKVINNHNSSSPILLHGVTGSGKTLVYLEVAKSTLNRDKNVLVLVPEISLTPQITGEFQNIHKNIAILHSQLTESERHQIWKRINNSSKPIVVIGPRSVLFAPISNVGLIVVDECHEPSYKQDQQPKYDSLLVAAKLAELHNSKIIFGSATPSVVLYKVAHLKKWPIVKLGSPVISSQRSVISVDSSERHNFSRNRYFSNELLDAITGALSGNMQSLIFHNRRGSSRSLHCQHCGWIMTCPRCHLPLILHHDQQKMRCHLCDYNNSIPKQCPECQSADIKFSGFGTKRLELELGKLFPAARVGRFDADTPKSENLLTQYTSALSGDIDILLGTQILTKGLDLPKLSVLGIVDADSGLQLPDMFAAERTFQTLYQAIGRIGRKGIKSKAIIQTYKPNNIIIDSAIKQSYDAFYDYEITERRALFMPPSSYLLKIIAAYATPESAHSKLATWANKAKSNYNNILVTGPAPAFHEHIGTKFRANLVIKSTSRKTLQELISTLPANWQFELDPVSLL